MKNLPKIIVILGPTSSGKSDLAVEIAQYINKNKKNFNLNGAEIISADSRQVYKNLDIGSGKVKNTATPKEKQNNLYIYKKIPHHLIDIVSPQKTFSVAKFQKLGTNIIKDLIKKNKLPIVCGGTGLYIDSLIYQSSFPKVIPNPKLRKELEKKSIQELFETLKKLDSQRAKNIDPKNPRRLIRALEIIITTGQPISSISQKSAYSILKIGINLDKKKLAHNISQRIKKMIKTGLIQETKNLKTKNKLSWKKIESFGFEYKIPSDYLRNKISEDDIFYNLVRDNNHYVKRQITWWKKDQEINWTSDNQKALQLTKYFLAK